MGSGQPDSTRARTSQIFLGTKLASLLLPGWIMLVLLKGTPFTAAPRKWVLLLLPPLQNAGFVRPLHGEAEPSASDW